MASSADHQRVQSNHWYNKQISRRFLLTGALASLAFGSYSLLRNQSADINDKEENLPTSNLTSIATPKIDLENIIIQDANILAGKTDLQSNRYVVVILESHEMNADGTVNQNAVPHQQRLYAAGLQLIKAGFTNVFAESHFKELSLDKYIELFERDNPNIKFGPLLNLQDSQTAERVIQSDYFGKGIATSWLVPLTFRGKVNFHGAEDIESGKKQAYYHNLLLTIEETLNSGYFDEMKAMYNQNPRNAEARQFLTEFNQAVDYVNNNYEWFIDGRSRAMIGSVLSLDNGILFAGSNHFGSIKDMLDKRGVNYLIIGTNSSDNIITFERQFKKQVENLSKYKVQLN